MPADIRAEYEDQLQQHERRKSPKALLSATGGKIRRFWEFYVGVPLSITLFFIPFIWRRPHMRVAFWALVLVLGLDNMTFFAYFPHYSAAVIVPIVLVMVQCLREMRNSGRAGLFLSRSLSLVCLAGLLIPICGRLVENKLPPSLERMKRLWQPEFAHDVAREKFVPQLEAKPGRQLVFVRYQPYVGQKKFEWIYNRADLERAKIIWAREPESQGTMQAMLKHFSGREVWLARPDTDPPRIVPYPHIQQ